MDEKLIQPEFMYEKKKNPNAGLVQIGQGRYVNPQNISSDSLEAAKNFQNTITADSLGGSTNAYNIPTITTPTGAEGLSGFATSYGEQFKKQQAELARATQEAEKAKGTEKKGLMDTMSSYLGIQSSREQLEAEAGLDKKAQKVTDVTNQIEASERAKVNELRALESSGLTDVQRSAQAREINRKYAFEQADLALIQSAANRDLETASNIINRKIELQLEPLKTKLEFQKMFYEENKGLFDKAEQRQFDSLTKATEREYEEAKTLEKYKADIQLEAVKNGVQIPAYVLSELNRAKTQAEVAQVLAKNGISLAKLTAGDGVPTIKSINGIDMQWNNATQKWETINVDGGTDSLVAERGLDRINQLDSLINNKTGLNSNAGLVRRSGLRSLQVSRDWSADAINVLSRLTVDELGRVKSDGVTFGALSDPERKAVGDAASALNAGMVMKDGLPTGKFKLSEDKVRKELETIQKYAKIDFKKRTGMTYEQYQAIQSLAPDDFSEVDSIYGDEEEFSPANYY